jgi:geranylgeranyl pyrophosphate synthase
LAQCTESEAQRLARFGELLGVSFQIADDVLDFMGDAATLGKPVGSDLRQGLITLPILLYMQSRPEDGRILTLLRDPTDTLLVDAVLADLRQSDGRRAGKGDCRGYIQERPRSLHT